MSADITKDTPEKEIRHLGSECKDCGRCCIYGSGILDKEDMPRIARFLGIKEDKLKEEFLVETELFNKKVHKPRLVKEVKKVREEDDKEGMEIKESIEMEKGMEMPFGRCIFFDKEKRCTIHEVKPFQCKISRCCKAGEDIEQWFSLNRLVDPEDAESIRQWASRLKITPTIKGGELKELVQDKEKLRKMLSGEYEVER